MKLLRQLSGLNWALRFNNEVAKYKKKLLKLHDFNPLWQLLALRLLCVSIILIKIMFFSCNFHVNEAIKIICGCRFIPLTIIRAIFSTYTVMCINYFG